MAFLKHEDGDFQQAKFACPGAEIVDRLFHGVADKHHRAHGGRHRLAAGFGQHFSNLGVAALAIDLAHQLRQMRGVGNPSRRAAFVEATVVDEADIETADRGRLAEHVGLQRAGHVPGRLPAHGGVEREYQPAPCAGGMRRHRVCLRNECGDVVRRGRRVRQCTRPARRRFALRFRFDRFAGHARSPIAASSMWDRIAAGSMRRGHGCPIAPRGGR